MRLIDADALFSELEALNKEVDKEAAYTGDRSLSVTWDDAIQAIKSAPTIEPERPTAKWIVTMSLQEGQITWKDYKCSNCSHHREKPMNFCEVCGAKMER